MTEGLISGARVTGRHGMTLVRLLDGVLPSGRPAPAGHPCRSHGRPVHIVSEEFVVTPGSDGGPGAVVSTEPVIACCGLVFEPGTVEAVAWGTVWPHEVCVRMTGHPQSFVSRVYREARGHDVAFERVRWGHGYLDRVVGKGARGARAGLDAGRRGRRLGLRGQFQRRVPW